MATESIPINDEFTILSKSASEVAPRLLGCLLIREIEGVVVSGRIVETEAYNQTDVASHSYKGMTPRNKVMFGPAGFLYVYFTYGMHYCMNVVAGSVGTGEAVLIRAIEPIEGLAYMSDHRGGRTGVEVSNGPAKVCQALNIEKNMNGHDLHHTSLRLQLEPEVDTSSIIQTTRIGLSNGKDVPWRFYIKDNKYVSKK